MPGGSWPYGKIYDGFFPGGHMPTGSWPYGKIYDGFFPGGHMPTGSWPYGKIPVTQSPATVCVESSGVNAQLK